MTAAIVVTGVGDARGSVAVAAALAGAASGHRGGGLLVDLAAERAPRPTIVASAAASSLSASLANALPEAQVAPRGRICHLCLDADQVERGLDALVAFPQASPCVVHTSAELFREAIEHDGLRSRAAVLRADLRQQRALTGLTVRDLLARGLLVRVVKEPLGWLAGRRALSGVPLGATVEERHCCLVRRLLGEQLGQALPLALGGIAALMITALALVSIAGALTGKGRAQRASDLAALSAARSMRNDLSRLLSPVLLPSGLPNPLHLSKAAYLARARVAARRIGAANGVAGDRLRVTFPDRGSFAPLQAHAVVLAAVEVGEGGLAVEASAVAEAAAPPQETPPARANGGGYSGPLAYRQGEGMRPDAAVAFDAMAFAAARAGLSLAVSSGFRSDAEQAALFAANPDPRWVAPPGKSLHRCATEVDLGPPGVYAWLAANAGRFGFVGRYEWEPWHYGYDGGPPPCSSAGDAVAGAGSDGLAGGIGLPAFVPARYRAFLWRSAGRWSVSAALLAAQLMAESGFDPDAVSPAGAQGIAQFMPATAAAYGLRDPFDPAAAIDAQAHLMADLLRQFRSPALALAAYNAGPAPVAACGCVPAIPETTAYVARILALLDGAGALLAPLFEVRLIE